MSEYVYVYIHPEYGYVYVGRTNNISARIKSHDSGVNDNIDAQYTDLLRKSSVYYIELVNKAESIAVEAYLINKEKPALNKMLVYENTTSVLKMELPHFIKMSDEERRLSALENVDILNEIATKEKQVQYFTNKLADLNKSLEILQASCFSSEKAVCAYQNMSKNIEANTDEMYTFDEVEWFWANVRRDISFTGRILDGLGLRGEIVCEVINGHLWVDGKDYGTDGFGRACAQALAELCSYKPSSTISSVFKIELERHLNELMSKIKSNRRSLTVQQIMGSLNSVANDDVVRFESVDGCNTVVISNGRLLWARLGEHSIDKRGKCIDSVYSLSEEEKMIILEHNAITLYEIGDKKDRDQWDKYSKQLQKCHQILEELNRRSFVENGKMCA